MFGVFKCLSLCIGAELCSSCASEIIKLASRVEHGELKLNDVNLKKRDFILQMISH